MSETNDNFDDLKRLLKLKRHEIPPPGFHNRFSDDVMARIRSGESGGGSHILERVYADSPFLAGWLRLFEAKPGIIGAAATGLCLLLLVGVIFVDRSENSSANGGTIISQAMPGASDAGASPALASAVTLAPADNSGITVSTNPVSSLQPVASLFGSQPNPLFQTAGFTQAAR
jgi:hypothetical protein